MADVTKLPENSFGYVPTPALVAPIEFTLRLSDYAALGGYMEAVQPLSALQAGIRLKVPVQAGNPWPGWSGKRQIE